MYLFTPLNCIDKSGSLLHTTQHVVSSVCRTLLINYFYQSKDSVVEDGRLYSPVRRIESLRNAATIAPDKTMNALKTSSPSRGQFRPCTMSRSRWSFVLRAWHVREKFQNFTGHFNMFETQPTVDMNGSVTLSIRSASSSLVHKQLVATFLFGVDSPDCFCLDLRCRSQSLFLDDNVWSSCSISWFRWLAVLREKVRWFC